MKKLFLLVLLVTIANISFAQYSLVKNFNNTSSNTFSYDSYDGFLANLGDKSFVRYDTTNTVPSTETLLSTITLTGEREKIISVAYRNEEVAPTFYDFKELPNGKMAFVVNATNSFKIILTDGTSAGTAELFSSTEYIGGMEIITNGLFFTHKNVSSGNYELMKINTTTNAVTQVIELGSFYPMSDINKTDENTLVFLASDPADSDKLKLYSSDGTNVGTTAITFIYNGNGVSQQTVMTKVGNKVFFFYQENSVDFDCCNFLWVTDGTLGGTSKLKEFNLVPFTDYEREGKAISWNDKFYFMAVDNGGNYNTDKVLWSSDGTTLGTIALNTTATFTKPKNFTVFNNTLYFIAYSSTVFNDRLYKTDGTMIGTESVVVTFLLSTLYPYEIITDNNSLFFAAYSSAFGQQMFEYNGINLDCGIAQSGYEYSYTNPSNLYVNGTSLYFTAEDDTYGRELFTASTFRYTGGTDVLNNNSTKFSIFPNPAHNLVKVKSDITVSQISLLNVQGVELTRSTNNFLNVENYPEGIYLIKVIFEDNSSTLKKLVISK